MLRRTTELALMSFRAPVSIGIRYKTSASSKRWLQRQQNDFLTKQAKAEDYKSRAAYKLKEINSKYKLFRSGNTVVDLGFAPGSWSQVAQDLTKPNGRVIGVDLQFAEPPLGVTAIQGNFLDPAVQLELETLLKYPHRGRYVDRDKKQKGVPEIEATNNKEEQTPKCDVLISDMCGIWPLTTGFWTNSINHSYRLAAVSGIVARDHQRSIDLCDAALVFAIKNLKLNGSFVCKYYTGEEALGLQKRLEKVFKRVHCLKPKASRAESREAYFVGLRKKDIKDIAFVFE